MEINQLNYSPFNRRYARWPSSECR